MPQRLEHVASYRDVPIWWNGGRYVAFLTLRGGNVAVPGGGFHTVAAAKRFVGKAINAGAVVRDPPRINPGLPKLKTMQVPGVRYGAPPARAIALRARAANPALTVVRNPSRSRNGRILTDRVLAIQYIHNADGKSYEHKFKRGVTVEFLPDGSARMYRKDGRPLWKDVV